jgi:hypothetical protein
MKRVLRAAQRTAVSSFVAAGGLFIACGIGGCSSDSSNDGNSAEGGADSSMPSSDDAGSDTGTTQSMDAPTGSDTGSTSTFEAGAEAGIVDSGSTTTSDAAADAPSDAPVDAPEAAAATFCQMQSGLNFCADFDEPGALAPDAGAANWTQIVGTPAEVALSTAQAASAPDSLLVSLADGPANTDRSAKVVEMITPANGVTQAIYEFDMYIATVPLANTGGFATDFQFLDTMGGSDQFGFRIGVFANTTGFDHADLEHNHPTLGGADDISSPIAITASAWNHVKMVVAYSAADGGGNVAFQLFLNHGAAADVSADYPAPFAKAAFARFAAGMVYAFDGTNKDWGIYYDNFTLKLQ